tara:strand:+ start:93 stop:374 length:282 start_codon:yes stop_codon:yes gene_type:complete
MSKKKAKKKTAQKPKPKKTETPKGWVVGAKVISTLNEKMHGTITDPEVSASDFWKNAPAETVRRNASVIYVRFVREDGATFGLRKDMLKLVED